MERKEREWREEYEKLKELVKKIREKIREIRGSMIDWYEFEQIIAKYFESKGYDVELNAKVHGRSGATYEIDVLAVDRNFNEIRIACQCKAWEKPVDRDHILHWSKVCEDIAAIPAFASTSGYTSSALAIAR